MGENLVTVTLPISEYNKLLEDSKKLKSLLDENSLEGIFGEPETAFERIGRLEYTIKQLLEMNETLRIKLSECNKATKQNNKTVSL